MKGKMADTYSYVSGELRCALFPLFVDGILRNTNKKKCSKWSHQNNFAHFLVSTRPNLLLFSNKRKTVKIGQNAFTLNQGDTPLAQTNTRYETHAVMKTHAVMNFMPGVKGLKTTNSPDSFRHYIFAGVEYKDDCPIQKYIPIYLIVAGSFGVFRNLISLCSRGTKRHKKNTGEEVEEDSAVSDFIEHVNVYIGIKF